MEVQENLRSNPQEDYLRKNSQNSSKGKDIGVAVLNILLAVVTVILLGYIAYKNGYIDLDNILNIPREGDEEAGKESSNLQDFGLTTFEGDYLTAILPLEWAITEYSDGEVTSIIPSEGASYTGLTGILITNNDKEIMKIEGVSGIGFIGCPELPRFEDADPDYEEKQEDLVSEIGGEIGYLDFTNTLYSEFTWLGKTVRRVQSAIYYDTIEGDDYFQPQCEVSFIRIEGLGFEDGDGNRGDTYMYTISEDATEEQLENLDKILTSMVVI